MVLPGVNYDVVFPVVRHSTIRDAELEAEITTLTMEIVVYREDYVPGTWFGSLKCLSYNENDVLTWIDMSTYEEVAHTRHGISNGTTVIEINPLTESMLSGNPACISYSVTNPVHGLIVKSSKIVDLIVVVHTSSMSAYTLAEALRYCDGRANQQLKGAFPDTAQYLGLVAFGVRFVANDNSAALIRESEITDMIDSLYECIVQNGPSNVASDLDYLPCLVYGSYISPSCPTPLTTIISSPVSDSAVTMSPVANGVAGDVVFYISLKLATFKDVIDDLESILDIYFETYHPIVKLYAYYDDYIAYVCSMDEAYFDIYINTGIELENIKAVIKISRNYDLSASTFIDVSYKPPIFSPCVSSAVIKCIGTPLIVTFVLLCLEFLAILL